MTNGLKNDDFRLDIDEALLAFSVLKKLGAGNVITFSDRLKSQKVQYLAQSFGVSPAYSFSLYVHGPYSPFLAHDLFTIQENKIKSDSSDFIPAELRERFEDLRRFIFGKNNRELELITTLHLFKKLGWSKSLSIEKLRLLKGASDEEITSTLEQIKEIP